ncbi:molybdopterin oxidoreductase [Spirochaetia bacterium]|nr:molybdopterin oxidoreductase [Spirochaetia bacterium]
MKDMICIVCPNGCRLGVTPQGDSFKVTGNTCQRGEEFAIIEMKAPMRTVTTTVRTAFPAVPVLPVRTADAVPKEKVGELMLFMGTITVRDKISIGDVVAHNALGLGVNIIAASNVLREG